MSALSNLNKLRERLCLFFGVNPSCAACGDIPADLGGRLCASLNFDMPLDIVILVQNGRESALQPAIADGIKKWKSTNQRVNAVYIVSEKSCLKAQGGHFAEIRSLLTDIEKSNVPVEAALHLIPCLQEYFCVIPESGIDYFSARALDFFTPNGIPLLLQADEPAHGSPGLPSFPESLAAYIENAGFGYEPSILPHAGIYGQRKTLCKECLLFFQAFLESGGLTDDAWRLAYQQWAYAGKKAILYSGSDIRGRHENPYI